jgi:hypothetical protein
MARVRCRQNDKKKNGRLPGNTDGVALEPAATRQQVKRGKVVGSSSILTRVDPVIDFPRFNVRPFLVSLDSDGCWKGEGGRWMAYRVEGKTTIRPD